MLNIGMLASLQYLITLNAAAQSQLLKQSTDNHWILCHELADQTSNIAHITL